MTNTEQEIKQALSKQPRWVAERAIQNAKNTKKEH
jgi:hypothetical protein